MGNFKWIPLVGQNMSAANLAAAEKLRRFGFAVNCGEFGSEKYTKCSLCVYDVLANTENPNILIISRDSELYSWYRMLITTLGSDFKIISGAQNSLLFFDEGGSGLYLISKETLFGENRLKAKAKPSVKWDLIIIDEELSRGVPDYIGYKKHIVWKADKLLINAPAPARSDSDRANLADLIKSVLSDSSKAAKADEMRFDAAACRLSDSNVVMRYYDKPVYSDDFKREVVFLDYGFDDAVINSFRRRVDLHTGLPTYTYGGNIFEQYDVDKYEKEKKIYVKSHFTRSDVDELAKLDKKLEALLRYSSDILSDEDARIMIYCCTKQTLEYLRKVFTALYGGKCAVERGETVTPEVIIKKLSVDGSVDERPKVIVGMDNLSSTGEGMQSVTCIINYELPQSAAILEKRMTRHGFAREARRKFVLFRDANKVFDTLMLERVLYRTLPGAFCGALPTRNILFDVPEKGAILAGLVNNLKYIRDHAKQSDAGLEFIKKVKGDYSMTDDETIANTKQLTEFAERNLNEIYKLFGISENSTAQEISAALGALSGLCVVNNGRIEKALLRDEMAASFEDDSFSNQPFAIDAVRGLTDAKNDLDAIKDRKNFHTIIRQEVGGLNDCIQHPVIHGIWKYCDKGKEGGLSFRDYVRIFNDGI